MIESQTVKGIKSDLGYYYGKIFGANSNTKEEPPKQYDDIVIENEYVKPDLNKDK